MRRAALLQVDSNPPEEKYSGASGGLMKTLKMDIDTKKPPSTYMVTAKEFADNMANKKLSDARTEHAISLNQLLLEDLFPKLCAVVPAGDTLPTVRFSPAQLKRDILMASTLREPMMSCEELCRVWDEWTITQLPTTTPAATEPVPSPRPEPLQSPTFSRKRIMFTIASQEKSAKKAKTNQVSNVVSSITSIPSTTTAKGQKLRSTMRRETPQPAPLPTQSRPVPVTSPTRSSDWSWGEPRTDGNCDRDVGSSSGRLPIPIDQNRIRHEAGLLDYSNYPPAPSLQQMAVFINQPGGNVHHGGNAAWNIQHHEAATAFQQKQYSSGSYMPPPWSGSGSSFNSMVGNIRTLGMGGFAENLQAAHPNFSAHQSIPGVGMHQMVPFQPLVRQGSNAHGAVPRGSPGGGRSRGGRGQRRQRPASRQHHQNASTRAESMNATSADRSLHTHLSPSGCQTGNEKSKEVNANRSDASIIMAGGAHRTTSGSYKARGFKNHRATEIEYA
jgi:hypothetical protein